MFPVYVFDETQFRFRDDFATLDTAATNGRWLVTKGTGGTLALQNVVSGALNVPTAALANDYQALSSQTKVFRLLAGKPIFVQAVLNCTEANTNQANFFVGLTSTVTSGFLQAASAGPAATFDGAVLYKVGGGLKWQFMSSAGSTQSNLDLSTYANLDAYASATSFRVGFQFDPGDGTTGYFTPFINGKAPLSKANTVRTAITYGSTGALYLAFGVLAGSVSAETLQIDSIDAVQDR